MVKLDGVRVGQENFMQLQYTLDLVVIVTLSFILKVKLLNHHKEGIIF